MSDDLEIYKQKAIEAIESVFRGEYHNSLGIPFPKVEMLLADDENYDTGQYYITIDNTWQIHLNFGLLPKSYKKFQDEVKVLTRHEIEHYMCCPFDVITHFRMLKVIRDVYNHEYASLDIDISRACASIANQAADIIVDTKNYFRFPNDTLNSEIDWIKKGADISLCPNHSKLMFLTKEAIWGNSLGINETDIELLDTVKALSSVFLQNGIDDKELFLNKTKEYARTFFMLYRNDKEGDSSSKNKDQSNSEENKPQPSQNNIGGSSSLSGGQNSTKPGQKNDSTSLTNSTKPGASYNGDKPNFDNQGQHGGSIRSKDGDKNGSAFVFADPDKVKEALEILAGETQLDEFVQILDIAGIGGLSKKDQERIWFTVQSASIIPIESYSNTGSRSAYAYPSLWRLGDSIEDLDIMLSLMNSPMMIPGITTKKWEMSTNETHGVEKRQRDLLLVVDTSGSMGSAIDKGANMHQAIKAAYGIITYFEQNEGKIALLGFNDKVTTEVDWTKDYNLIKESLLTNGGGGTVFPIKKIEAILDQRSSDLVTVLITDGEITNTAEAVKYFRDYLSDGNKLYIFILGTSKSQLNYNPLTEIGAQVYSANTASEFCNIVLSDLA